MYQFPAAAVTNHHKLDGLKQQKCILLQSLETQSPKSRCGRSPRGSGAEPIPHFSPSFWKLPRSSAFPGLYHIPSISAPNLTSPLCVIFLCLGLIWTHVTGLKAHLNNSGWSHLKILNLTTSAKTLNEVNSQIPGIRTWTYLLGATVLHIEK